MARTTRRRRRKHRGTQAGGIDRRGRTSRPRSRQEARARARRQLSSKHETPPTWGSALRVAGFGGVLVFGFLVVVGHQVVPAIIFAAFMVLLYLPIAHLMNRFQYNRRQGQRRRRREED